MVEHMKVIISIIFSFAGLLLFHCAFPADVLVSTSCEIASVGVLFFILSSVRRFPKGWRVTFSNLGTLTFLVATAFILLWSIQTEYNHNRLLTVAFGFVLLPLTNFALRKNKLYRLFSRVKSGENLLCNYENTFKCKGVKLAVISDLHIPLHSLLEGNIDPDMVEKNVYDSLIATKADDIDYIIILGDVTDTGNNSEWDKFYKIADKAKIDLSRVIIVPGNHDININSEHYPSAENSKFSSQCSSFLQHAFGRLQLPAKVIFENNEKSLSEILSTFSPILNEYCHVVAIKDRHIRYSHIRRLELQTKHVLDSLGATYKGLTVIEKALCYVLRDKASCQMMLDVVFKNLINATFPLIIEGKDNITFLLVNSCTEIFNDILNCGFGRVGKDQRKRIRVAIQDANTAGRHVVMLIHHYPMMVKRSYKITDHLKLKKILEKSLCLSDASDLIEEINQAKKCTVINGHLHYAYHIKSDDNHEYISVPSTCYGDDLGKLGKAFTVILDSSGETKIRAHL